MVTLFIAIGVKDLLSPTCESGTLVGNQCLSCPDGYTLNLENKKCTLDNINHIENETTTITNEEIIANYKRDCKEYSYEEVFRYAEKYKGDFAKFTGKVIQIVYDDKLGYQTLRINVTKKIDNYEDTIYVLYMPMKESPRILENDIVTIYGMLNGLETYTSVLGTQITIPSLTSTYIEIQNN